MSKSFATVKILELKITSMFADQVGEEIGSFYSDRFGVPHKVSSQYIKQRIASNYDLKLSKFNRALSLNYLIVSIIKYLGLMLSVFVFSKKIIGKSQKFSLLIDDIQQQNELDRWYSLEQEFTSPQTVYVAKSRNIKSDTSVVISREILKGYDRSLLLRGSLRFFFRDLVFLVWYSFRLNINLIHLHSFFINDYLYYYSLFKIFSAKYMIQDRNLGRTNALKNHLFKQSGGVVAACVQKNIVQHDGLALFYDIDIFFSYGDKTLQDALSLGGRVDHVFPVGSFAMEKSIRKLDTATLKKSPSIDVLFVGINAITSSRTDWRGYYKSVAWLVKLASESQNLRIAIKHHPSWIFDKKELEIIEGSGITYLEKNIDSYELAYRSKFIITYGSSMGYELAGHGLNVIFLDPDKGNPFINQFVHADENVISDYKNLKRCILAPPRVESTQKIIKNSDYCYSDSHVSKRIYEYLISVAVNNTCT